MPKSPLESPLMLNFKSDRHIKDVGTTSGGLAIGGKGQVLQWSAKWEAAAGSELQHRGSAKLQMGILQGNSLTLSCKCRFPKNSWLEEFVITLPKWLDLSTVLGRFPKVMLTLTHEFSSLATRPTLGFGMEHDVTLGSWTWIWELGYRNSTFRVPIPVIHLGSVADPGVFYRQKLYYGIYCVLAQSMMADILAEPKVEEMESTEASSAIDMASSEISYEKTKMDAEKQLALMEKVAERKRCLEQDRDGLVILRALYWMESRVIGVRTRASIFSMDATKQLQFWVVKGRLSLSVIPKSCWLGFYDLQTDDKSLPQSPRWDWRFWRKFTRRAVVVYPELETRQPQLTIRYTHNGYVYDITVGETEALVLPSEKAHLLGHISIVQ
jgi:hypothetical protein